MIDISKCEIRKMTEGEPIGHFDRGDDDLNDFIINDAGPSQKCLLNVSYLVKYQDRTLAYFSLAYDKITINDFPDRTTFNRFRRKKFVNAKRFKSYHRQKYAGWQLICPQEAKTLAQGF